MKYIPFIVCVLILLISIADSASRGGSRGGSSRSSSSRSSSSRSSSRSSSSRSSYGSSSSVRTIRTGTLFRYSSSSYSYGIFSGSRFGTVIRRTYVWPIRRVYYGYRYTYYRYTSSGTTQPPQPTIVSVYNYTDVPQSTVISDLYIKMTNSDDNSIYNCTFLSNSIACLNPSESVDPISLDYWDGGCCEDGQSNPICCVIALTDDDDDENKAVKLGSLYTAIACLILSTILLLFKLCK